MEGLRMFRSRGIRHISVIKPSILMNKVREKHQIRPIICVLLSRKQDLKFELFNHLIKLMQRVPFKIVETNDGELYDIVLGFDMGRYMLDLNVKRDMDAIISLKEGVKIYVAPIHEGKIPSMNLDAEAKIIIENLLNKYIQGN